MTPRVVFRAGLAIVLALVLAGCASVPVSTLWRMRSFDAQTLARVQPRQLRVAGLTEPGPMRIDPARSHLEIQLTPRADGATPRRHTFGFRETAVHAAGLLPANAAGWQVFELDEAGIAAWTRLQPEFVALKEHYSKFEIKVSFKTEREMPDSVDAMIVSSRLQLLPDEAPIVLFDRAKIPIERDAG